MHSLHEPVYRPILRDAFHLAWIEKRYWPIAIFAGILLTGSVYDIIWKALNALAPHTSLIGSIAIFSSKTAASWSRLSTADLVIGGAHVLVLVLFAIVIGFAVLAMSVIAQSALVYAIGARKGNTARDTVKQALAVGGRALWPVLALNLIAIAVLFASRALIAMALSFLLAYGGTGAFFAYLLSFILFTGIGIATVIVQIFALNAMILQGATLAQAIERGFALLARDWVTALETAALLFAVSFGGFILLFALGMVVTFVFLMLTLLAITANVALLASLFFIAYLLMIATLILALFGFMVLLHYAAWTLLYRRLGEGGIVPKLHRIVRNWVHSHHVKGT